MVVIDHYFQIWNKKKGNNIIICKVISCHMDTTYIETPYIYMCVCVCVYVWLKFDR